MATGSALVLLLLLPFQKATAFVSDVRKWLTASQLVTHVPISVFTPTVMPVFDLPPTACDNDEAPGRGPHCTGSSTVPGPLKPLIPHVGL